MKAHNQPTLEVWFSGGKEEGTGTHHDDCNVGRVYCNETRVEEGQIHPALALFAVKSGIRFAVWGLFRVYVDDTEYEDQGHIERHNSDLIDAKEHLVTLPKALQVMSGLNCSRQEGSRLPTTSLWVQHGNASKLRTTMDTKEPSEKMEAMKRKSGEIPRDDLSLKIRYCCGTYDSDVASVNPTPNTTVKTFPISGHATPLVINWRSRKYEKEAILYPTPSALEPSCSLPSRRLPFPPSILIQRGRPLGESL